MQNFLNKKNITIAGIILVIIIGALIFSGSNNQVVEGEQNGIFGGLFPEIGERLGLTPPSPTPPPPATETEIISTDQPLSADEAQKFPVGTLMRLSKDNTASIAPFGKNAVRYHKNIPENLGHLFERNVDATSEGKRISNFTIPQIVRVVWASDGKHAVIFYELENQIRKLLVDYATATPKTNFLPDTISDVAFSPDSKSLAFVNDLGETKNIFVATSDFKNQKKVFDNKIPGLELSWPAANMLAVKTRSSYAIRGFLYTISVQSGALNKIAEGFGLDAVWNGDGSGVLYSTSNTTGTIQNIKFIDVKAGSTKEFPIPTIAEKCVFAKTLKNLAYCAMPRAESSQKLPDAWWQGKVSFQDDIVALDISSGQTSYFASTPSDVTQLKIMPNDSYILFRDKTNGNLWSLKLK